MAKGLISSGYLSDIADAIRSKLSVQTEYKPTQMAAAISSIPSGGGSTLITKTITQNGTYNASSDNADGYSQVTVNVSGGVDNSKLNAVLVNGSTIQMMLKEFCGWFGFKTYSLFLRPVDTSEVTVKPNWSNPYEIFVTCKYLQNISRSGVLFGAEQGFYYCPSIEFSPNGGGIWCGFTSNGSSWTDSILFSSADGISIAADMVYTIKEVWDGTKYTVTVNDGTTTVSKDVTPSSGPYYSSSYNLMFGGINRSSNHYLSNALIDFGRTYIKENGVLVWGSNISA